MFIILNRQKKLGTLYSTLMINYELMLFSMKLNQRHFRDEVFESELQTLKWVSIN
jgi:hypothetical protein